MTITETNPEPATPVDLDWPLDVPLPDGVVRLSSGAAVTTVDVARRLGLDWKHAYSSAVSRFMPMWELDAVGAEPDAVVIVRPVPMVERFTSVRVPAEFAVALCAQDDAPTESSSLRVWQTALATAAHQYVGIGR